MSGTGRRPAQQARAAATNGESKRRIAVLGGAGGIGRAVVSRLTSMGDEVIVLDQPAALEKYPSAVPSLRIDVRSPRGVARVAASVEKRLEALDGLVCLSGIRGDLQPLEEVDLDLFDEIIAVNLRGFAVVVREFMPLLRRGVEPSLVLMSSALASTVRHGYGAYSISKAGILSMTKTLALEAAPHVRVNAVGPSAIDTAFSRGGTGSDESKPPTDYAAVAKLVPMGRVGVPEDVVGPIVFLLGPDSRYMTGQMLWITGGLYMP